MRDDKIIMKTNMKLSNEGKEELIYLEGLRLQPYQDEAGHLTIGVGHKIKPGEVFSKITKEEAMLILEEDVKTFENIINNYIPVQLTQNQFDALVIFIFNIGDTGFLNSTVYQNIKLGHFEDATIPWARWIHVSEWVIDPDTGIKKRILVPVDGLINRREREIELFRRR